MYCVRIVMPREFWSDTVLRVWEGIGLQSLITEAEAWRAAYAPEAKIEFNLMPGI